MTGSKPAVRESREKTDTRVSKLQKSARGYKTEDGKEEVGKVSGSEF